MKFGICIPTFGDGCRRLAPLLETIERFTVGFDYEVFVRDDATPEAEFAALSELVCTSAGAEFIRGKEWGMMAGNFHEVGLHAISKGCDIIVYINDDCLMSRGWLEPIAYFYEWNVKLRPAIVSGTMIEAWELAMNDVINHEYDFYSANFYDWSNNGTLLREHLAFSQELFDAHKSPDAPELERVHISTFHPIGPIVDGRYKLDHPVPNVGGIGPYFAISAEAFQEVNGFDKCWFTGDYEAMIGLKCWDAGYVCCTIPAPPAYHARGVASYQAYNAFPEEKWIAYRPWTEQAKETWRKWWPSDSMYDMVKDIERRLMSPASGRIAASRFIRYQNRQFPVNVEYNKLSEISLGLIHWEEKRQRRRMCWLADRCEGQVLDVGCANGGLLDFLSKETTTAYTGVDLDRVRIDEALRTREFGTFYVLDATYGLPFNTDQFQAVVCADVLEHIPRERAVGLLQELVRVARCRLLLTFPISEELRKNPDHIWDSTVDEVQEFVSHVGAAWEVLMTLTDDFALVELERDDG